LHHLHVISFIVACGSQTSERVLEPGISQHHVAEGSFTICSFQRSSHRECGLCLEACG